MEQACSTNYIRTDTHISVIVVQFLCFGYEMKLVILTGMEETKRIKQMHSNSERVNRLMKCLPHYITYFRRLMLRFDTLASL